MSGAQTYLKTTHNGGRSSIRNQHTGSTLYRGHMRRRTAVWCRRRCCAVAIAVLTGCHVLVVLVGRSCTPGPHRVNKSQVVYCWPTQHIFAATVAYSFCAGGVPPTPRQREGIDRPDDPQEDEVHNNDTPDLTEQAPAGIGEVCRGGRRLWLRGNSSVDPRMLHTIHKIMKGTNHRSNETAKNSSQTRPRWIPLPKKMLSTRQPPHGAGWVGW